ncbi:MAG: hypothetical protein D9V44_00655 [Actinobacteria bacterium]|nr:MAG: hypothetical protein D9V44_00655 [Actinomycetota bacterium]
MSTSTSAALQRILGLLHRLCDASFADVGITLLAVIEDGCTRVILSASGTSSEMPAGSGASFRFTHARLDTLLGLGVTEHDLATAAYRELLDQLAASAPDKTAFMRGVFERLGAECDHDGPVSDEVHRSAIGV